MRLIRRRLLTSRPPQRAIRSFRPLLELLEDRRLLASNSLAYLNGHNPAVSIDNEANPQFVLVGGNPDFGNSQNLVAQGFGLNQLGQYQSQTSLIQNAIQASGGVQLGQMQGATAAGGPSNEFVLATPTIATASGGGAAVGINWQLYASNGTALGSPSPLLAPPVTIPPGVNAFASVDSSAAMSSSNGDFVLAVESTIEPDSSTGFPGSHYSQVQAFLASGAAASAAIPLNDPTGPPGTYLKSPMVAMDAAGDFVVVGTNSKGAIVYLRFNVTAQGNYAPGVGGTIRTAPSAFSGLQYSVAMDAAGDFVVASGGSVPVQAQVVTAQGVMLPVVNVAPNGVEAPAVGMDAQGDFVVGYNNVNSQTGAWQITANRYGLTGTLLQSFQVPNLPTSPVVSPGSVALAMNAQGWFAIALDQFFSQPEGVFGELFGPLASPANADVTVTKTADSTTVNAGQTAGFTVSISNVGKATATGLTLSDHLPAGLGSDMNWKPDGTTGNPADFLVSGGVGSQSLALRPGLTLAAGQTITVHITALTTFADAPAPSFSGTLPNTASVSAANEPAVDQNQTSSSTITVVAPDADVTNMADQTPIPAGSLAEFTVTVTNEGQGTATGVTLSVPLPAGAGNDINWVNDSSANPDAINFIINGTVGHQTLAFSEGGTRTLTAGQSLTANITGITSAADAPLPTLTGTLPSTATVNATNEAPAEQNALASASIDLTAPVPAPDVDVVTTADQPSVDAGTVAGFTVRVFNEGNLAATNVDLADLLPAGFDQDITWQIDGNTGNPTDFSIFGTGDNQQLTLTPGVNTLGVNQSLAVHVTGITTFADIMPTSMSGFLNNNAEVFADDELPGDQVDTSEAAITIITPDVTVLKTADQGTILAGQTAGFTIQVANQGSAPATFVSLDDPLPTGASGKVTWQIDPNKGNAADFLLSSGPGVSQDLILSPTAGDLGVGAALTVHITAATTAADAPAPRFRGTLLNTATVSAINEAPFLQNAQSSATIAILFGNTPVPQVPSPVPTQPSPGSSSSSSPDATVIKAITQPPVSPAATLVPIPLNLFLQVNAAGFVPTTEAPPFNLAQFNPSAGPTFTTITSGLAPVPGDISGVVFLDRNGNGIRDPGDPGIPGLTVFIDRHGDGLFHPDDPQATTNERGEYVFHGLPLNRTYQVRPVPPQFMVQTYPQKASAQIVTLSDSHPAETDVTFGTVPFRPVTQPIRPVATPEKEVPAPMPPPPSKSGEGPEDEQTRNVVPEELDSAFQAYAYWRAGMVPVAFLAAYSLGQRRDRRRGRGERDVAC